jgi:hypothetical protein
MGGIRMGELVMERSQAILSAINSFGAKSSIARKVKTLIHSFRRCHPKCYCPKLWRIPYSRRRSDRRTVASIAKAKEITTVRRRPAALRP